MKYLCTWDEDSVMVKDLNDAEFMRKAMWSIFGIWVQFHAKAWWEEKPKTETKCPKEIITGLMKELPVKAWPPYSDEDCDKMECYSKLAKMN